MRPSLALLLFLSLQLLAAEAPASYPLWDGRESVESYAARIKWPATKSIDLGKGVTMDFVLIPAGRFIMGTPPPKEPTVTAESGENMFVVGIILFLGFLSVLVLRKIQGKRVAFSLRYLMLMTAIGGLFFGGFGRSKLAEEQAAKFEEELVFYRNLPLEEKPGKEVTIGQPFYMGKYTVTEQQYAVLLPMPDGPVIVSGGEETKNYRSYGENAPVMCWLQDAVEFCKKLETQSTEENLVVQLPSDAEWEYACRSGTTTLFYSGNTEQNLDSVGWYDKNSEGKLHAVGMKVPNAFGLFDMHGNIWQWCENINIPIGIKLLNSSEGKWSSFVVHGGSYSLPYIECRSSKKILNPYKYSNRGTYVYLGGKTSSGAPVGFRVILKPSPKP